MKQIPRVCRLLRPERRVHGVDSPFAVAVARDIKQPHIEVRKLLDLVRDDVGSVSKHQQQPFTCGSPPGWEDFCFVAGK